MDRLYQRSGSELLPVNLGSGAAAIAPGALEVVDGVLVKDTDKLVNVDFTVTDGILEVDNG